MAIAVVTIFVVVTSGRGGFHGPRPFAGGGPQDHCNHRRWLACVAATVVTIVIDVAGGGGFHGPRPRPHPRRWWWPCHHHC